MSALDPADHAAAALMLCREIAESYEVLAQVVVGLTYPETHRVAREMARLGDLAHDVTAALFRLPARGSA